MKGNAHVPAIRARDRYTIDDYWMAVYRRKWIILVVVVAAAILAAWLSRRIEPRYEARADFYVPQDVVSSAQGPEARNVRIPGMREHARVYVGLLRGADAKRAIATRIPGRHAGDLGRAVDLVVSSTGYVRVYARDRDPEVAALIANSYVQYFQEFHHGVMRGQLEKDLQTLDSELIQVQDRKRQLQEEVRAFKKEHLIASMSAELSSLEAQKSSLQSQLRDADVSLVSTTQRLAALEMQMELEDQAYTPSELSLAQSAVIRHLHDELETAEAELAEQQRIHPAGHAEIAKLRRRHQIARQALEEKIRNIDSLPNRPGTLYARLREQVVMSLIDMTATEARAEGLRQALRKVEQRIETATVVALGLERRLEEVAIAERFVSKLISVRDNLSAQSLRLSDVVIVTQQARPPSRPVFPRPTLNVAVAAVGGLIVGIIYALFLDYLENRPQRLVRRNLERSAWTRSLAEDLVRSGQS